MFTQKVANSFYHRLFDKLVEVKRLKEGSVVPKKEENVRGKEESVRGKEVFAKEESVSAKKLEPVARRFVEPLRKFRAERELREQRGQR